MIGGEEAFGVRLAARVSDAVGRWSFIVAQAVVMAVWVAFNVLVLTERLRFDPYPFVLLNLGMSAEAAFTGPILLIAANVAAGRDRRLAEQTERLAEQSATILDTVARVAQADHVEHGRLLQMIYEYVARQGR